MKIKNGFRVGFFLIMFFIFCIANNGFAASTGTTNLLCVIGSGAYPYSGDYISSDLSAGLNLTYRFYIEVPPSQSNLTVDIYDADIGAVANYTDWIVSGGYNTSCLYTLIRPDTTTAASATYNWTQTTADSVWTTLYTVSSPAAGHWELIVNMSTTGSGGGNDTNGFGIRAHDGTPGAGGTELNIYAYSFVPLGVIGAEPTTKTTTFYPYFTSGCTVDYNDFDGDDTGSGTERLRLYYTSRASLLSGNYRGSDNDSWNNRALTGFRTDVSNVDMGIWTAQTRFTTLENSTANFGVFWAGNWQAASGAPSTQPQANSFRVYLPTDAGGAPAKPILTQKISWISGPNPPVHSTPHTTTRLRVSVVMTNLAAKAITFSSTKVVTAYVPGTAVVYAGNTSYTQGSIVSQPTVGSGGTVSWNPGTVAAGATAELHYQIDVTPTASGRLVVTGAPTANGTQATYVDETGNTTQTRATYTFGPLCELAINTGTWVPTWVAVSCFEACAEESQPTVEWHTASEMGAVGFNLWRQDKESGEFQLVNPQFLPSLLNSPQGGVYRLADPGAPYGEAVVYRLEEVDTYGQTVSYGPFTVTFGVESQLQERASLLGRVSKEVQTDISGYRRFSYQLSDYEQERLKARSNVVHGSEALLSGQAAKERVRIAVKGRGLFYVAADLIGQSLGISSQQAASLILNQQLDLTYLGQRIAWLSAKKGSGIYFYNEGLETLYSEQNIYFLEKGSGLAMETVSKGSSPANAGQTFRDSLHFEENHYGLAALFSDPLDDIWLWDYVVAEDGAKTFSIFVHDPAASGSVTLTVNLKGATDTEAASDHHARVMLNGTQIGDDWWDGTQAHTFEITFNASQLQAGVNTLAISGALDMGAPYSVFYVESFDLSYPRYYQAVGNSLLCRGDGNATISVAGFSETSVMVWDVTQPARPKQVLGVAVDVLGRISFSPRLSDNRYLAVGLSAALKPLSVSGNQPAQLKQASNKAEYVVIAPEEFRATAQKLADYRNGKGLKAMVVTLEDIYDVFNNGMPSPYAVKEFLAYAYKKWSGAKLQYAVLAGKGTFDYKDYQGYGDNLVPPIMAKTPNGLLAADKNFGNVKDKDGVPEIAIGRLPAITNAELQVLINKIKTYDGAQGAWTGKALLIADNADNGGDFASSSDNLAALLSGYTVERIYHNAETTAAETRQRIIDGFNSGAALVNYYGHAGLFQLAEENLLNVSDMALLQNQERLPIMVMLTCMAGHFEIPGFVSLGEALLLKKNGGIVAALAPNGAALNSQSTSLGEEFYRAALRGSTKDVGQAWLEAMKKYIQKGGAAYMLNIYNWLGDPALACK